MIGDDAGGDPEGDQAATQRQRPEHRGPVDAVQGGEVAGRLRPGGWLPVSSRASSLGRRRAAARAGSAPSSTSATVSASRPSTVAVQVAPSGSAHGVGQEVQRRRVVEVDPDTGQREAGDHQDAQRQGATEERLAVPGAAYGLDTPADHLTDRGGRDQPGEHHDDGGRHGGRRDQEGRDAEQGPGLEEPGDAERRQQQGAEVVHDRADRVRRRTVAGRRISRPPPEATAEVTTSPTKARQPTGNRRRTWSTRSGSGSRPASIPISSDGDGDEAGDQPAQAPAAGGALPGQPEGDQGPQVPELVSPGARGRHRPRPPPPAGRPRGWRPAHRRAAPARHRTPPWPARAGAWTPAPRRRGRGRRR